MSGDDQDNGKGWDAPEPPPPAAFHIERVAARGSRHDAIAAVRHPSCAWSAPLPDAQEGFERRALDYLADLAEAAGLVLGERGWLHPDLWERLRVPSASLPRKHRSGFGWLPATWTGPHDASPLRYGRGPLGSIGMGRIGGTRTLVLLAGNVNTYYQLQFGADIGLRIVVHVDAGRMRIHGVTLSNVSTRRAIHAVPQKVGVLLRGDGLHPIKQAIADALVRGDVDSGGRLVPGEQAVWLNNIEHTRSLGDVERLSVSGLAAQVKNPLRRLERSRVHDFRLDVYWNAATGSARVVHIHRNNYIGSAANAPGWPEVPAFERDGASQGPASDISTRRPTRTPAQLEPLRRRVPLFTGGPDGSFAAYGAPTALRVDAPRPLFETSTATPAKGLNAPPPTLLTDDDGVVQLADLPAGAPIMSDAQGSIETHLRATDLFARLWAYGFEPEAYFRFARLPLVQRVRPAMTWAPDGELPNAEVRPFIGKLPGTDGHADGAIPAAAGATAGHPSFGIACSC